MFPTQTADSDGSQTPAFFGVDPSLAPGHEAGSGTPLSQVDAFGTEKVVIGDPQLVFLGHFERHGSDLVVTGDSNGILVRGYFDAEHRAALVTPDGTGLSGSTVEILARPEHPGIYAQSDAATGPRAIGKVELATGSVTVTHANGLSVQVGLGDLVYQGDVVETAAESGCGIVFLDGTTFHLASAARMVLNEFVYDPHGSSNSALFALVEGAISFVAARIAKTGHMLVETPAATLGIRGTTVQVIADSRLGSTNAVLGVDPDGGSGAFDVLDNDGAVISAWLAGDLTRVRSHVSSPGSGVAMRGGGMQSLAGTPPNFAPLFAAYALGQQDPFIQQQQDQQPDDTQPHTNHGRGSSTPPNPVTPPFAFNFTHSEVHVSASTSTTNNANPVIQEPTAVQQFFVPTEPLILPLNFNKATGPAITIITPIALSIAGSDIVNSKQASSGFKITGTTSGVEDGQVVTIKIINSAHSVVEQFETSVVHGAWSVNVDSPEAQSLADGTYIVTADVSDRAGDPAPEAVQLLHVDQTPPSVVITSSGGPTNAATQVITGKVDIADAGTTVTVLDGTVPLGHAKVQADGSFSVPVTLVGSGTHVLTAEDTDPAGNTGTSNQVVFKLDTMPPKLSFDCIALEHDTGVSDRDFITSDGHVKFSGHVADSLGGLRVEVFDNNQLIGTATIGADGSWALSADLAEGVHRFSAVAISASGNTAEANNSQVVVVDKDPGEQAGLAIRFVDTVIHEGDALHVAVTGLHPDDTGLAFFSDTRGCSTTVAIGQNGEASVDLSHFAAGPIHAVLEVHDVAGNGFMVAASNEAVLENDSLQSGYQGSGEHHRDADSWLAQSSPSALYASDDGQAGAVRSTSSASPNGANGTSSPQSSASDTLVQHQPELLNGSGLAGTPTPGEHTLDQYRFIFPAAAVAHSASSWSEIPPSLAATLHDVLLATEQHWHIELGSEHDVNAAMLHAKALAHVDVGLG